MQTFVSGQETYIESDGGVDRVTEGRCQKSPPTLRRYCRRKSAGTPGTHPRTSYSSSRGTKSTCMACPYKSLSLLITANPFFFPRDESSLTGSRFKYSSKGSADFPCFSEPRVGTETRLGSCYSYNLRLSQQSPIPIPEWASQVGR